VKIEHTIPGALPSLNQLLRFHWAKRKRLKDQYLLFLPARARVLKKKMRVSICVYQPTRRFDIDNLYGSVKILIDSLRKNKLICQDSPKWLDLELTQAIDRENPRTEIEIEEVTAVRGK